MAALSDWPWRHWARQQPDEPALINQGAAFSWSQLARQIDQLATGLMQQGVRSGCGVVLKARNSQPALLAYLALLQCGARVIPLNPQLPATQLAVILPTLNADFALSLDGEPVADMVPLRWVVANGSPRHQWDDRQIATLTLTSGSSGQPKAAAHTFAAHLASAAGVVDAMNFTRQDRWLLSLPLFHVSGQGIVWRWLRRGAARAWCWRMASRCPRRWSIAPLPRWCRPSSGACCNSQCFRAVYAMCCWGARQSRRA